MNWYNLRQNKCPKCSKELEFGHDKDGKDLFFCHCTFSISGAKFKNIVNDIVTREVSS